MRSYHSVCTGNVGFFPGQGMRRSHNDSTRGSSGRASGCGRDRQDLDRTLADGLGVQRTIVRHGVTCIPPRREIYRVNQGKMARNSGFLGKIISTILIAVREIRFRIGYYSSVRMFRRLLYQRIRCKECRPH